MTEKFDKQARVNHYQFWILATLEWRLYYLNSDIKEIKRKWCE